MFRKKKNDNVYEEPNQRIKQVKAKAKGLPGDREPQKPL